MNDLRLSEPLLLFALRREAAGFLDEFEPQQTFPGGPCRAYFAGPSWLTVLVLETGVGAKAVEAALEWALAEPVFGNLPYRPRLVLSAGFGGALAPNLRVGDLVLADEIITPEGHEWPAPWPGELPPGPWEPPLTRGRLVTVSEIVSDPARKRELGDQHRALAADMESAVVARLCRNKAIPFGCLRVVSDDQSTPLSPRVASLAPDGRVSWLRLLWLLLRSPGSTGELWRLAKLSKMASKRLGKALGELLTLTLDWME
jgi:adenosylhomocysteine nucleosidase